MADTCAEPLRHWIERWGLRPDGEPITAHSSVLLPVLSAGRAAMLKVALIEEEARGARQLARWSGNGAAEVFAIEGDAVLMERAKGGSLARLATHGRDEDATSILCRVASRLHRPVEAMPDLVPLASWFGPLLEGKARGHDFTAAAATTKRLLAAGLPDMSLHGDLHHHNVLDFGEGDWRAIDPKGLRGERTFDFVPTLRNPDALSARAPGRLEARVAQIAAEAELSAARLLAWTVAVSGLSAIWLIEDGYCAEDDLAMLRRASALLSVSGEQD